MYDIAEMLMQMSDNQLDAQMKPYIVKWNNPPSALQVLEVLDYCIHGALASGFVVATLQTIYDLRCKEENTTHEEVVKLATWRTKLEG